MFHARPQCNLDRTTSENLEFKMVTLESVQKNNAGLEEFARNLVAVFGTSTFEMSSLPSPTRHRAARDRLSDVVDKSN